MARNSKEEMIRIWKEIVDFHGEMVLLENYSALNYTGLAKILKKYDKSTCALLRLPFIQKVLQQPFFTTDLLYKLVKECELMLECLFPANECPATLEAVNGNEPSTSSSTPEGTSGDRVHGKFVYEKYPNCVTRFERNSKWEFNCQRFFVATAASKWTRGYFG